MHTFEDESGITFHFDGGLESGELSILIPEGTPGVQVSMGFPDLDSDRRQFEVCLPVEAILRLVAYQHVQPRRMAALDDAEWRELLA